jgi:hypothetical protein
MAHHDNAVNVGMGSVGNKNSPGKFRIGPQLGASMLMLHPGCLCHQLRNPSGYLVCTDHGGDDDNMIADPGSAVCPAITHKLHNVPSPEKLFQLKCHQIFHKDIDMAGGLS